MKLGITGNGMIASKMLEDIREVPGAEAAALCVLPRSREKGEVLAQKHGIPLFTDYEAFLRCPEVDVVYIGVVNSEHYRYARQALLAGKHVLCEKPFTTDAEQLRELTALARSRGLFLWESQRVFYSPVFRAVRAHLDEIGDVKLVQCNMSKISSRFRQYEQGTVLPVFDPALDGGCLWDLNIYNICFAVTLFGKPQKITSLANYGWNGVDTSGTVILEYDGFLAVCTAAKDSDSPNCAAVQGTRGTILVEGPPSAARSARLGEKIIGEDPHCDGFFEEISEIRRQFAAKDLETCYQTLEQSQLLLDVLAEAVGQLRH